MFCVSLEGYGQIQPLGHPREYQFYLGSGRPEAFIFHHFIESPGLASGINRVIHCYNAYCVPGALILI